VRPRTSHPSFSILRSLNLVGCTLAALVCLLALLLAAVPGIQAQQISNSASVPSQAGSTPLTEQEVDRRVNALLQQMTLEEKIGQLAQLPGAAFIPDAPKPEDRIRKGGGGSVLWLSDPATINRLQRVAVEPSRLHMPVLFGLDVIHGFRTIFPVPLALASSWDPSLVEQVQTVAAREA
jgi:beta-glucosidase